MSDHEGELDVKVHTVNRVFNAANRMERVDKYVNSVYCDTDQNRKIRKAFRNQLIAIIKEEDDAIKASLRVIQRKEPMRKRMKRQYRPTPYVQFCRDMRSKYPHEQLVGKMQQMWRDKRRGASVEPKTEEKTVQFDSIQERERYINEMRKMGYSVEIESDED